jgi:hypothetical protein
MRNLILLCTAAAAFAVAGSGGSAGAVQRGDQSSRWRDVATEADRERLRLWRRAWIEGLREARAAGHGADIDREGALLHPDAGLLNPAPPPGAYRCRTIKIGGQGNLLDWVVYPTFRCRIGAQGGALTFTKLTGSQRPIGQLYPAGPRRMVFLGAMQLGDERRALRYGADSLRDMAGHFERVGDQRWRLVIPRPTYESIVDVIELVPAR